MRAVRTSLCLLAVFLACTLHAQTLYHQRLAVGLGAASDGVLSDNGHVAYLAAPPDGEAYDPWIGGRPFATDLLTGDRTCWLFAISRKGSLLWGLKREDVGPYRHVYWGRTDLSAQIGPVQSDGQGFGFLESTETPVWTDGKKLYLGLTPFSDSVLGSGATTVINAVLDASGNLLWSGSGPNTSGYRDVFWNSTNISASVLGAGPRLAGPGAVRGTLSAWFGSGSTTGGNTDTFLGSTNLSRQALGPGPRWSAPHALSGGVVLWSGWGDATAGAYDVFVGQQNLSQPLLGAGTDRSSTPIGLSASGDSLWIGQSMQATGGFPVLFRNISNYSTPILGSGAHVTALGITDEGVPIWAGTGTGTAGMRNVFFGTLNVTKNAYSGASRFSFLMAMNGRGQFLWRAEEPDGWVTVWLSSPSLPTTLTGDIELSSVAHPRAREVTLEFLEPGTGAVLFTAQPQLEDGRFVVTPSQTGLFDIRVRVPHFLTRMIPAVPVCGDSSLRAVLINGDVTLDNRVDLDDLNAVLLRFASSASGDYEDLNENGTVDLFDLSIVVTNFAQIGE